MERVTFNALMDTLGTYINEATNPRNDGWTHNHYRKWINEIKARIDSIKPEDLVLHGKKDS
tara:strand:- start:356 stop:538 length:183 start_codon:yes stop_codon:yes gene_type:complete